MLRFLLISVRFHARIGKEDETITEDRRREIVASRCFPSARRSLSTPLQCTPAVAVHPSTQGAIAALRAVAVRTRHTL